LILGLSFGMSDAVVRAAPAAQLAARQGTRKPLHDVFLAIRDDDTAPLESVLKDSLGLEISILRADIGKVPFGEVVQVSAAEKDRRGLPGEDPILVENIAAHVRNLESLGNRHIAHKNNKKAGDYIFSELKKYGYAPVLDYFEINGKKYFNVLSNSSDKNKPVILLSAHFDSFAKNDSGLSPKAPGADDNASGVAVLLELARALARKTPGVNVEFAFFNAEEYGCKGSKHLAESYSKDGVNIFCLINVDTVGTWKGPISDENPLNYVTNEASLFVVEKMRQKTSCPLAPAKEMWMDDHASFWDNGYAAIEITENGEPESMHTPDDTSDKLNYDNIAIVAKTLYRFVASD